MALCAASVVVIDEGDGAGGPPPDDPRRFALRIPQPPELPQVQRFLQHPLGAEVEPGSGAPGGVAPVHDALAVRVLVVRQPAPRVIAAVRPHLSHNDLWLRRLHVLLHVLTPISLGKVEPPAIKAHVMSEPRQPGLEVASHPLRGVVQIGSRLEEVLCFDSASASELGGLVANYAGCVPRISTGVLVPLSVWTLLLGTSVVDHHIGQSLQAVPVKRGYAAFQVCLVAVGCAEAIVVLRHVAFGGNGLAGRWKPHGGDACLRYLLCFVREPSQPVRPLVAVAQAAALPVEALEQHLLAAARWIQLRLIALIAPPPAATPGVMASDPFP
mmetsp:Transcript_7826/g.23112  ORF Transcript_7826/g.23112 Transcript_7826/m.23112 type:complete len:327 (-) Transcript_7826:334-1314(-)